MDKTTVIHVKNNSPTVHHLIKKIPEFNAAYGLWIFSYRRHGTAPKRQTIIPRYFEFYGLSHLIKRSGWYWQKGGRRKFVPKGCAIITTPGTIHDYGCRDNEYIEDSICFTGPAADQLFNSGIISDGIIEIGSARQLLPIFELTENPSHSSQIKANFALQKLLIDCYLKAEKAAQHDSYLQVTSLTEQIQQNPGKWWTTSEMAEYSNLSENQFRVIFKRKTGMSPKHYVDQVKVKYASEQLCSSSFTIARIAALLGYRDPYHFSRRFKHLTGMSPEHYRRNYSIK